MKIVVIHGEDTARSRARLEEVVDRVKAKGYEVVRLSGQEKTNLTESTRFQSLFGTKQLYLLDDFDPAIFLKFITSSVRDSEIDIIAYFSKEVGKLVLKGLPPGSKLEKFDIPQKLWTFLDSFYPGNRKILLKLLHEAVTTNAIEMVVAMLARQLKDVYWVKLEPTTFAGPPWRLGKLKNKDRSFSITQLRKVIRLVAKSDYESKTGQADLLTSLDLTIIKELE